MDIKDAALQDVRTANARCKEADAHRTDVIELAKLLGCSNDDLREALEISKYVAGYQATHATCGEQPKHRRDGSALEYTCICGTRFYGNDHLLRTHIAAREEPKERCPAGVCMREKGHAGPHKYHLSVTSDEYSDRFALRWATYSQDTAREEPVLTDAEPLEDEVDRANVVSMGTRVRITQDVQAVVDGADATLCADPHTTWELLSGNTNPPFEMCSIREYKFGPIYLVDDAAALEVVADG